MPIGIVACQTRRFQREYRAHLTCADRGQQGRKSRTLHGTAPGLSLIFVDDNNFGESKLLRELCSARTDVGGLDDGVVPDVPSTAECKRKRRIAYGVLESFRGSCT